MKRFGFFGKQVISLDSFRDIFQVSRRGDSASPESQFRAKLADLCSSGEELDRRLVDLHKDLDGLVNDPDMTAGQVIKYLLTQAELAGLWTDKVTPLSALRTARKQGILPPKNTRALAALEQRIRDARRKTRAARSGKVSAPSPDSAPSPATPDSADLRKARREGIAAACGALEALIASYQAMHPRKKTIPLDLVDQHLRRLSKAARNAYK